MSNENDAAAVGERLSADELSYLQVILTRFRQAELERENYLAYLTGKYKATADDNIDVLTGVITRITRTGE